LYTCRRSCCWSCCCSAVVKGCPVNRLSCSEAAKALPAWYAPGDLDLHSGDAAGDCLTAHNTQCVMQELQRCSTHASAALAVLQAQNNATEQSMCLVRCAALVQVLIRNRLRLLSSGAILKERQCVSISTITAAHALSTPLWSMTQVQHTAAGRT
jgi:hypothetical protein